MPPPCAPKKPIQSVNHNDIVDQHIVLPLHQNQPILVQPALLARTLDGFRRGSRDSRALGRRLEVDDLVDAALVVRRAPLQREAQGRLGPRRGRLDFARWPREGIGQYEGR
jgi:hypothetical protein